MTDDKYTQIQNPQDFVTEFKQHAGPKFLIDVREPEETAQGILNGAQVLPSSEFNNRLSEIPKSGALYLYCRSGARANRVAQYLFEHGWSDIRVATGFGYADLKDVY
jgi:rhodanese-related sulfurtransferase